MCRLQERGTVVSALRAASRPVVLAVTATAAGVVVADQLATSWALRSLHHPEHLFGPFGLDLQYNRGSAFSLLDGSGWLAQVLAVLTVGVVGILAWRARRPVHAAGFGLVLGGALGNLGDRWFRGHHGAVVDYVTLSHWPTFNVADACITIGVVVLAISVVIGPRPRPGRAGGVDVGPGAGRTGADATANGERPLAEAAAL